MKKFVGQRVYEGYAIGNLVIYKPETLTYKSEGEGIEVEKQKFFKAREEAVNYYNELYLDTFAKLGEKEAEIFSVYKLMAEDLDLEDFVIQGIEDGKSAEFSIKNAGDNLSQMFEVMEDEYMRLRAKDVKDVTNYLLKCVGKKKDSTLLDKPSIIICDDIPANELMKINKDYLLGLVCINGNNSSHVSILCRMLEVASLAALDGVKLDDINNGDIAIIDGTKGQLVLNPSSKDILKYKKLNDEFLENKELLKKLIGEESVTLDGKKTKIYANIASSYEVESVLKNDAEGIGLFRSEFLYLQSKDYPTEEEQFGHYKRVVEGMKGKEVIIRTLDIGADKKIDYFDLPEEENPALGYRSIRICKDRPDVFLTQLCALYRASKYGKLSIMVPMIISLNEVKYIKEMCALAKDNLRKRNIEFDENVKLGIMIETPAAAVISDELAKEVDFFSIGTNDLSQYTLACDRVNASLKNTFDPHHKAILRLIALTVKNAHAANITVGICGELGRDKDLAPFFLKLGIDELSVSPTYVLSLRDQIKHIDTSKIEIENYI